jgi:hypothetical protein
MSLKETIKTMKTINIDINEMDRELAILLYKGKMYEHTNHQYAFKEALEEEGLKLGYDIENEIDKVSDETYRLSKNNEIFTYSIFEDGKNKYFIAHFKNHLEDGWEYLKDYIQNHNFIFGYFNEEMSSSDKCTAFVSELYD